MNLSCLRLYRRGDFGSEEASESNKINSENDVKVTAVYEDFPQFCLQRNKIHCPWICAAKQLIKSADLWGNNRLMPKPPPATPPRHVLHEPATTVPTYVRPTGLCSSKPASN
jgi:hypothetical protein